MEIQKRTVATCSPHIDIGFVVVNSCINTGLICVERYLAQKTLPCPHHLPLMLLLLSLSSSTLILFIIITILTHRRCKL